MKKKSILFLSLGAALLLLFAVFTVLVKMCDVKTVTYGGTALTSAIGFGGINLAVFGALGQNGIWYTITEVLGYVAILLAAAFAVIGLCQWIKRKKLFSVDREILLLAVFYVAVMAFYVLFELIVINYRPVLIDGELEASYPSSHSMLALSIFLSAPIAARKLITNRPLRIVSSALCGVLSALTVAGRLLSGVHWLTDIVGAVLLSAALILLYLATLSIWNDKASKITA